MSTRTITVLLLFLLALLPRLFRLDAQSLWLDEGGTWQAIQQPWSVLLADLFSPAAAYPLYHLLLKGWVLLAGDSEWALRLPSALAGAAAVPVVYLAALEMQGSEGRGQLFPLAAALLLTLSPFALWYAQEAKVYSLLLLVAVLLLWSFLRARRLHTRRAWLLFAVLALASIFVHRLALLLLLAAWAAILLAWHESRRAADDPPLYGEMIAYWLLLALACGAAVLLMVRGLGTELSTTGAYPAAGPGQALWLTFLHFSFNRGPGELVPWWGLPWAGLLGVGSVVLIFAVLRRWQARVLLCFLLVPLVLFLAQLAATRIYEPRYMLLIFPAWLLLLAYPLEPPGQDKDDAARNAPRGQILISLFVAPALLTSLHALRQPEQGLFSGDPVKEQYRATLAVLAEQMHPDDAIILHPAYLEPLYDYYMRRLTSDPAPEPITFEAFKHFQTEFNQRDWDQARSKRLAGYTRSFLLIAPEHARTVDRPLTAEDEYGVVGLYYRYSREQQKWPCGIWRFNGVHLYCQDSPEAYITGTELQPQTLQPAQFGEHIVLQGYTLKATTPAGRGVYRAGGTLPITLFWEVTQQPAHNYSVFLHLCQDCDLPPAASTSGPPLEGYLPTSTWTPGNPVHDEQTIPLPRSMPPGRYTLLLGLYPSDNPAEAARLPVQGDPLLSHHRLVLTTVEIVSSEN